MTVAALYVDPKGSARRPGVGSTVRYRGAVGTVKSEIEPTTGWLRCFVSFDGYEQYVDDDNLEVLTRASGGGA